MIPNLTANDLFEALSDALQLNWESGRAGSDRPLEPTDAKFPGMALVGHLNYVHTNRVQVIGMVEAKYLSGLDKKPREEAIIKLFGADKTAVVVLTNSGKKPPTDLCRAAERFKLALFSSPLPSPIVIDHLQYYLTRALAPSITVHGVYMEVMGMGVLITGESGIGKSELALELLSRNHRLIADDAVEFIRVGPDVLVGQCPNTLSDYLEVRGLGILDIRLMFGETAVRHKKKLHLIVRLERLNPKRLHKLDRLQTHQMTRGILHVDVPEVALFVAPGRNLAVLVEAATRSHILRTWGIDTLEEFMKRHQALIDTNALSSRGSRNQSTAKKPRKRRRRPTP
jgi:HPr kinase/phosphorylase